MPRSALAAFPKARAARRRNATGLPESLLPRALTRQAKVARQASGPVKKAASAREIGRLAPASVAPTPAAPREAAAAYKSALDGTMAGFARAAQQWLLAVAQDPAHLAHWQAALMQTQAGLFAEYLGRLGQGGQTAGEAHRAWCDYLNRAHQAAGSALLQSVDQAPMADAQKGRMRFFMKQLVDMAAPQNQLLGNYEALKLAQDSEGESLKAGAENLRADMRRGQISMVDESAFEVGRNLATAPGSVIFECPLFQLIQYQPSTAQVFARPILLVPPCINKFYILDMQPENSLVRYLAAEGFTVFLVSWRNVNADLQQTTWDDYVQSGVIEAITVAREAAGIDKINLLGFCVGGTLVGETLAVLAATQRDWIESVTFLTTLLDFSDVGEIRAFIDEQFVAEREVTLAKGGLVPGAELAQAFAALRANDLIWSFVINNYLKGKKPAAFDLLYWNSDSTNLPGPMYAYYLRNMYLENNLAKPKALTCNGVPVDLSRIRIPAFVFAAREDHIVPWRTAYRSARLLGGDITFVLGASGHIAGVVNPPAKMKRSFWSARKLAADGDQWLASARETPGSWWPTWSAWLAKRSGKKVAAPKRPGGGRFPVVEPAPGRYVKEKCMPAEAGVD
jgi:polyhydroxyalkanoate synthase